MSTNRSTPDLLFGQSLTIRQFLTGRRFLAAFVTLCLGGGAGLLLSITGETPVDADEAPADGLPVEVVSADLVDSFQQSRRYTGTLVARRTADLSFERGARLVSVLVDDGDVVEAGQTLAQLDTRHLKALQKNLTAQRAAAAALLSELQSGPRRQTISATQAQVAELEAQLELSRLTHSRTQQLSERRSVSQQTLDDSLFSFKAAAARLDRMKQRLDELQEGTRSEKIDAQQALVQQLDAQLADLELSLDDSILTAPFAGHISMRHADEGTVVAVGVPVLRLVESGQLEARIGLPAASIRRLSSGTSHTLDVAGTSVPATFVRVLPEVDLRTRTQTAVFELPGDTEHAVAPGQMVRMQVTEKVDASGYWVPTGALSRGQRGLWSAYVAVNRDGHRIVESRPVEVLHTEGDRVLISGTVQPGDLILAGGTQRVVPGQRVSVIQQQ